MKSIEFKYDWVPQDNSPVPELRVTSASFSIFIDNSSIISFFDDRAKSIRSDLNVPLYPLAEWFVLNWWFIFGENREHHNFNLRHNISNTYSGFSFPNLSFKPEDQTIFIKWNPWNLKYHHISFLSQGSARVLRVEFETVLREFINSVLYRLQENGITDTLLHQEWEIIKNTDEDEKKLCLAAAALGLDIYSANEGIQDQIIEVDKILPRNIKNEFFINADANNLIEQAKTLLNAINHLNPNNTESFGYLKQLRNFFYKSSSNPTLGSPWQQGYNAAQSLRSKLGWNGHIISETEQLARDLKINLEDLRSSFFESNLDKNFSIKGAIKVHSNDNPGFVFFNTNKESSFYEQNQRFTFCRSLYEYLFSPDNECELITSSINFKQKRNRAFAAELIIPAHTLREMHIGSVISREELEVIAENINVPSNVVQHQLENHKIATIRSEE